MRARFGAVALMLASSAVLPGCASSTTVGLGELRSEPVLTIAPAGTSAPRILEQGGDDPEISLLWSVTGDWNAVSVELARSVPDYGWIIESINCVGTGNDIIARKLVGDTWLLLESGAGARGAGLIVSVAGDQRDATPLAVTGRCPGDLVEAASSG